MDSGRGFLVPPDNNIEIGGHWVPLTPGRPSLLGSNSIPIERQGNQVGRSNWNELASVPHSQPPLNYKGDNQDFNIIGLMGQRGCSYNLGPRPAQTGSFDYNVGSNDIAVWDNNPLAELFVLKKNASPMASGNRMSSNRSIQEINAPTILNTYSKVDSSWTEANFTSLLLGGESPNLNDWYNADSPLQRPQDGFPIPSLPKFNLNSPPRSETDATSSTSNSFPFATVTPDQTNQFKNHHHSDMLNFSVEESSTQEKDKLDNLLTSMGGESIENHSNELLQNIVHSSSAAVSTQLNRKNISEDGDQGIDLNRTPHQKTPKRRKHRPRVVAEGKPKRTPKVKTPNTGYEANTSGKRKYVRKKNLEATAGTEQTGAANEVTVPIFKSKAKSTRRKLNFDSENDRQCQSQGKAANLQEEIHKEDHTALNLNLDSRATKLCTEIDSIAGAGLAHTGVQNGFSAGKQQEGGTHNLTKSMNQMPERYAPAPPPAATKRNDALNAIARSVNMRCADTCQKSDKNRYSQKHQYIQGELNVYLSQVNTTHTNLKETRQMIWQNTLQMVERNMVNSNEQRGSKRCVVDQAGPPVESQINSPLCYQEIYQVDNHNNSNHNFGMGCSETHKKRRMENGFHSIICSTPCVAVAKDDSKQVVTESRNSVYAASSYMSQTSNRISVSNFEGDKTSEKLMHGVHRAYDDKCFPSMTVEHNRQKNPTTTELHLNTPQVMAEKRSSRSIRVHNITSPTMTANAHQPSSTPPKKLLPYGYEHGIDACPANMSVKRHRMASTSCKQVSSCTNTLPLQEQKDASHDYRQPSMKARGEPEKQQETVTVDNITWRLQGLNISDGQENYALVPYKGQAEIVPYQPFDPIKKRKPRPKVDLDPETNRLWNLLMGKEGHKGMEAGDREKEKWWEEERKIFRGRADSFIARMHLVQGDRRFSQWKGSVVDSVIGVFLTQNVSDHLSSSAFMSLAARFPLRSTATDQTCYKSGTSTFPEEPVIQMLDPYGTINCYQKTKLQSDYIRTSIPYHESSEHGTENPIWGTGRTSIAAEHNGMAEEKASSSQNSSDSCALQVHGEIQSCSGSNSGAEDSTLGGNLSKIQDPPSFLHTRRNASFQVLESHVTRRLCFVDGSAYGHKQSEDIDFNQKIPRLAKFDNLENSCTITHPITSNNSCKQAPNQFQLHMAPTTESQEVNSFGMLREESISSLPSAASQITTGEDTDYMSRIGHAAERICKTNFPHNEVPMIQAPTINHPTNQGRSLRSVVTHTGNDQISLKTHQRKSGAFALEIPLVKEPIGPTEAVPARQSGTRHEVSYEPRYKEQVICAQDRTTLVNKQKSLKNKAVEANAKEQVYFSGETTTGMSTNMPSARKGKVEGEKRKSLDWDGLRKLVQPYGQSKERTTNTMDSLDYEALRCADVNDISNAIRERGMNNMLAERMKDFLNRLVREHGSVDLEWLRDIPPDKAKDYLLSIWGLGLKSVECVRLLSLHHVAFPVDTNVGRIAVRLGWVPLQPLPESLQLHLLELYPMLESIQKYLWPRLCKLDQRTLYELHYQMITFGKVFCTKSKPNCNACPMRGECRHFASAFASARLALPGPEEKSMVSSTTPIAVDKSPAAPIRAMLLPPAGCSKTNEMVPAVGSCEPIVEEPTTPELETTEVSQSDIEDAFYEDPDEIPTIELNIQEFTQTLHQYMQENDMSKALVAINPEAASIPIPKLKNVSRLRTEHQVYELPDSHPLLNGMDKREPDDPSPYLLAIWTPGETANSIQPPERRCGSQESDKLCNEKTCFSCNSVREANSQTVRGTFLIPCRTAMRGSFPLNGTYFQVNEMFADHESSLNPIDVPRALIWNLPRRTVYFGTSVTSIFRGLPTEGIQYCFWRGFVCVRGFDQKTRAPRPLQARFHFPASKLTKTKNEENKSQ